MNRMALGLFVAGALAGGVARASSGEDDPYATNHTKDEVKGTDGKVNGTAATKEAAKPVPRKAAQPSPRVPDRGAASGEPEPASEEQRAVDGNPPGRWVWGS